MSVAAPAALPWTEARNLPTRQVAARLGLTPARERHKYACLWCDSSDALHVYQNGVTCFSCGTSGSNIDLAMAKLGLTPTEALRWLTSQFGLLAPDETAPTVRPRRALPFRQPQPPRESPAVLEQRATIYTTAINLLTLTDTAKAFLTERGLPYHQTAIEWGFRGIDGAAGWDALAGALRDRFPRAQVADAFPGRPWGGQAAVLLIPFGYRGHVQGLRFRNLDPRDDRDRYRNLKGRVPPILFNHDALDGSAGAELHVTEGELNCFALAGSGLRAVGLSGVQMRWSAEWSVLVKEVERLVMWFDADPAGDHGAERLTRALRVDLGPAWVEARLRYVAMHLDVNELLRQGKLDGIIRRACWRT